MSTKHNQADKLAQIGAQLKQIREEKSISLQAIKDLTLISERQLRAIEDGNLDLLPEPIYIQGFIRKYGSAMGIDGLAEQFPLSTTPIKKTFANSAAAELRPLHLYVIYIVLIGGAVSLLSNFLNPAVNYKIDDRETKLSKSARLEAPKKPIVPAANQKPIQKKGNSKNPVIDLNSLVKLGDRQFKFAGNKPVNIGIQMKGESWLRVEVDGKTKFEGILTEGTQQIWSGEKNVVIRVGNAAAVLLAFNQFPTQPLGKEGEVTQQVFDSNYKPKTVVN